MAIDASAFNTSMYQSLRPVEAPSYLDAAGKAANLSSVGLQQKRMAQEIDQGKVTAHLQKASAFGNALEGLSGLTEQERAAAYPKMYAELVQAGILSSGQAPEQYDPGFYRQSLMRYRQTAPAIENQLKKAQTAHLYAQASKEKRETLGGKQLPSDKVLAVSEGQRLPMMLQDIRQTIETNSDTFGPVVGQAAALNPWGDRAKTIDAQMRTAAQSFGRYMEGGVLRKEDEDKYRKMFPQLSDTPDVAANKLVLVDRLLRQKQAADVEALRASGYNTAAFNGDASAPDLPEVLTRGSVKGGVAYAAEPGSKPKRVRQGGHIYILNEKTGEYE